MRDEAIHRIVVDLYDASMVVSSVGVPPNSLGRLHELLQITTRELTHRGHVIYFNCCPTSPTMSQLYHDVLHQSPNIEVPNACVAAFDELISCLTYIASLAACFHLTFILDLSFVTQSLLDLLAHPRLRQDASPFLRRSIVHVPPEACAG